jgi:uncharacterized membrane protein YraQ (UPF0718 family)
MLQIAADLAAETFNLIADASVYLLIGFFFAGLIHAYFPREKIHKYFGGATFRSVWNAGILGVPLPLCSCAVIPTAAELRKRGAGRGATLAFLISTPETGADSIGISFALLDPLLAVFRPISALITALSAGIGANFLEKRPNTGAAVLPTAVSAASDDCSDDCCAGTDRNSGKPPADPPIKRLQGALVYAFGELLDDIAVWLLIGFIAAALVAVVLPDQFFAKDIGSGLPPMILMMLLGIPLYMCATASTPIAAAMLLKGLSPGAALVFLLVGPATNIGSLLVLSRYFEKKYLAIYLAAIILMSLLLGGVLNFLYAFFDINIRASLGSGAEIIPQWLEYIGAAVLIILLLRSFVRQSRLRRIIRIASRRESQTEKNLPRSGQF